MCNAYRIFIPQDELACEGFRNEMCVFCEVVRGKRVGGDATVVCPRVVGMSGRECGLPAVLFVSPAQQERVLLQEEPPRDTSRDSLQHHATEHE